jgi:hypothetical protein
MSDFLIILLFGIPEALLIWILFGRNLQLERFRYRLLREESDYLARTMYIDNQGGSFARYFSLPSHYKMMWMFWIPLHKWERPLSDYYSDKFTVNGMPIEDFIKDSSNER